MNTVVAVYAPEPFAEALSTLPAHDRKRIAQAVLSRRNEQDPASNIHVVPSGDPAEGLATILPELIIHREMMVEVSEGRQRIQEVNDFYTAR